jgi:hypothetical protein
MEVLVIIEQLNADVTPGHLLLRDPNERALSGLAHATWCLSLCETLSSTSDRRWKLEFPGGAASFDLKCKVLSHHAIENALKSVSKSVG